MSWPQDPAEYCIIYNWDGAPHGYTPVPQSTAELCEKVFEPIVGTQCRCLFWCVGEHTARSLEPSGGLETVGDLHGRVYENAGVWVHSENILQSLERGENPHAALIEHGHSLGVAVWASLRMNDNHFNGAQPSELGSLHHTELTQLRREHPEWLLGDRTSEWFASSWNLAVPEVREHRLAHVREACLAGGLDWDGLEVDWQRHAFHLPDNEGYRLRYVITDMQRAIRQIADEISAARGRPFRLAVRVAGSIEQSLRQGYDVAAWVAEGLIDVLIPAGNAATDGSTEVDTWRALVEEASQSSDDSSREKVLIFPGFDNGLPRADQQPESAEVGPEPGHILESLHTRGLASRWHSEGADGMYCFNWHQAARFNMVNGRYSLRGGRALMNEIGGMESLLHKDKVYPAAQRVVLTDGPWRGAFDVDRLWGDVPVPLLPTTTGRGPVITFKFADEQVPLADKGQVQLRLRVTEWTAVDAIKVRWDGALLTNGSIVPCERAGYGEVMQVSTVVWHKFALEPSQAIAGKHTLEVALAHRNPQVISDIVLTDAEILFDFGSPPEITTAVADARL